MIHTNYKQVLYNLSDSTYVIVTYYNSNNIHSIKYYKNDRLHHPHKPAVSFYKNDFNNSLEYEYFYYNGKPSNIQEGNYFNIYKT